MSTILIGNETFSNLTPHTQVYLATHNGAGKSLPYMNKSFISFTFGGKAIEDFNLIVVNASDRMERNIYAPFTDSTSKYDTLDGQLYWGSKIEPNQLDLTLATDGITEQQLDKFKKWFVPGRVEELILSEHPNRAIYARVAAAPVYSFLPFENSTNIMINHSQYTTKTTLYRGEISLSFIMDDPYWFSKLNYMPQYIDIMTLQAHDAIDNENCVESIYNKDMLKIMLEDGLPHQSMFSTNTMFLGDNTFINTGILTDVGFTDIDTIDNQVQITDGLSLDMNEPGYLFYSGTAPSYPIIQFSLLVEDMFDNNNYIICPKNKIVDKNLTQYSYIAIDDSYFYFTTPSMLTGYNQAMALFRNNSQQTQTELLTLAKTSINEYYSRAWAIKCLNQTPLLPNDGGLDFNALQNNMKKFFNLQGKVTFTFNSKTGEATGIFYINNAADIRNEDYIIVEENIGDMARSNYLVIEGRNYINSYGEIDCENDCSVISTNEPLKNVIIFFKNMYL